MNKVMLISALTVALFGCQTTGTSSSSTAELSSGYNSLTGELLTSALQAWEQKVDTDTLSLISDIEQVTGTTSEQALGGVGSLLALAQGGLNSSQNSELSQLVPGYSALENSGLSSVITNNASLERAFTQLGLSPSMIDTFSPLLLDALQAKGASSGLLQSLSSFWGE